MRIVRALVFIWFIPILGYATETNSGSVEIFSDELHYFPGEEKAVFQGNVQAYQNDIELESQKMTVMMSNHKIDKNIGSELLPKDSKIKKIMLDGGVVITTHDQEAESDRGEYEVETGITTLYGNVKLNQGKNWITGEKFMHNRNTGENLMYGSQNGQRVKSYFVPKGENE